MKVFSRNTPANPERVAAERAAAIRSQLDDIAHVDTLFNDLIRRGMTEHARALEAQVVGLRALQGALELATTAIGDKPESTG